MPTINLEMMKQLLQEFSEKEALTTEEIGVIEEEILNLEARIESCRAKLKNLNSDKDKLAGMQQRYASGNFALRALNDRIPQETNIQPSATIAEIPARAPIALQSEPTDEAPAPSTESKSTRAKKQKEPPENQSENLINENDSNANIEPANTSTETKSADNKDTGEGIKSLNDALKGLFRK